MMMTGEQYKESLKDGRYTYLDGKRVTDPANEPRLKAAVQAAADVYDSFHSDDPDEFEPDLHHAEVDRGVPRAGGSCSPRAKAT